MRLNLEKKKAALGVAVLGFVGIVGVPVAVWVDGTLARSEWEEHRQYWKAKGEQFDSGAFEASDAFADPAEDSQDAAAITAYHSFFDYPLQPPDGGDAWLRAMPMPLASAFELEEDQFLSEEDAATLLLEEFRKIDRDLDSFVRAVDGGASEVHSIAFRYAELLQLRAVVHCHVSKGNMDAVERDVITILRAAELLLSRPSTANTNVNVALAAVSLDLVWQPVWQGLRDQKWSAQQLRAIIQACEGLDSGKAYVSGLRVERALMCEAILAPVSINASQPSEVRRLPFYRRIYTLTGHHYRNATNLSTALQLALLSEGDVLTDGLTSARVARIEAATRKMGERKGKRRGAKLAYGYLSMIVGEFPRRIFTSEVNRRLAVTAMRVELYRQERGGWPGSLSDISDGGDIDEISGTELPRHPDRPDEPLDYGIDFIVDAPVISLVDDSAGISVTWRYAPEEE